MVCIGAMVFAHVPILSWAGEASPVLGRESYHLVYIHNLYNKQYYYVTTQEGLTGYVKASQCVVLSVDGATLTVRPDPATAAV